MATAGSGALALYSTMRLSSFRGGSFTVTRGILSPVFDGAEIFLHPALQFVRPKIADHNQGRIIGPVEGRVKSAHLRQFRSVEVSPCSRFPAVCKDEPRRSS